MGWLQGILGGYVDRQHEIQRRRMDEAANSAKTEGEIYKLLLGSPDAKIRQMAATGILSLGQPRNRKRGMQGWMGEMEGSPVFQKLQQYATTPQTRYHVSEVIDEPPLTAAQPTTSPTTGGEMTPTSPLPTPGQMFPGAIAATPGATMETPETLTRGETTGVVAAAPPAPPRTTTHMVPETTYPSLFPSGPETEMYGLTSIGIPEAEARQLIAEKYRGAYRNSAGQSFAEGDPVPDPDSPTGWSQILYLRADPRVRQKIPAQPPNTPAYMAEKAGATTAARNQVNAGKPLTPAEVLTNTGKAQDDWSRISNRVREAKTAVAQLKTAYNAALAGNKAPATEAIIVLWQKALDSISVVREAEANRPGQFVGLADRMEGAIERLRSGGAVVPLAQLKQYVDVADQMTQAADTQLGIERQRIIRFVQDFGGDPRHVVGQIPPGDLEAIAQSRVGGGGGVAAGPGAGPGAAGGAAGAPGVGVAPPAVPRPSTPAATPQGAGAVTAPAGRGGTTGGDITLKSEMVVDPNTGRLKVVR